MSAVPVTRPASLSFECPVCEGTLGYTQKLNRFGQLRWFCNCFSCDAEGLSGGDYLRALGEATGVPAARFLERPPDCLGPPVETSIVRPPAAVPSADDLLGWQRALARNVDARRYLREERGLWFPTIRRAGLGFDGEAIVLPCFNSAGDLVNVKRRAWPDVWTIRGKPVKALSWTGCDSVWYPGVLDGHGFLLCAGEFDALLARQLGLPAISTTCGVQVPARLIEELQPAGRRIAVCFDVGEEGAADKVVAKLVAAGAEAWRVDLGLGPKQDITDWFVTHGRSAYQLRALISAARKAAR